jgi:DNA invertase Pin-like site-specific DNA recombinase
VARKSRKNLEVSPTQEISRTAYYAGGYIRLSVVDRKSKGDSLENQQAIINSFIAEHSDIELREIYIDNGHSGQSFERPSFQRMLADMENGKINCCITKDLSRLGRNAIDSGYYIERHFPLLGVRYIAVTDNYDSSDGQSGGIILSLKNMINEAYALDASRKVKATVRMNINKGNFIGGCPPYGYLKSEKDCHKLVIDERTAPVVKRIFEMYTEGQSVKTILDWLNTSNILPPRRYFYSIGLSTQKESGAEKQWWGCGAVYSILKDRMYCGDMVQSKHTVVDNSVRRVPKSEWIIVENTHEAVISRELFVKVQEILGKSVIPETPAFKLPNTENIFLGKIFCGDCGYSMPRRRNGEKAYGFRCNTRFRYSSQACGGMKITENALKSEVLNLLRKYKKHLANITPTTIHTSENDTVQKELLSVQSEYDRNKRFLSGLYERLVSRDISDDEYKEMKSAYELKISLLTKKIKHLREEIYTRTERETVSLQAHKSMQKLEQDSDLTSDIIGKLIDRITIYSDGRIAIKFSFLNETVINKDGLGNE